MVERKHVPVDAERAITIVTEEMAKHESPTGEKIIDLPVCDDRYASQSEAEDAGFAQAREWIVRNMPRVA